MAEPPTADPTRPDVPTPAPKGRRPERSLATAYLVWFLVGIFGGHRFYLGDARGGRWFLIGLAVGIALPFAGLAVGLAIPSMEGVALGLLAWIIGLIVLLAVLLATIVDAFRLPAMTRRANDEPDHSMSGLVDGAEDAPVASLTESAEELSERR